MCHKQRLTLLRPLLAGGATKDEEDRRFLEGAGGLEPFLHRQELVHMAVF